MDQSRTAVCVHIIMLKIPKQNLAPATVAAGSSYVPLTHRERQCLQSACVNDSCICTLVDLSHDMCFLPDTLMYNMLDGRYVWFITGVYPEILDFCPRYFIHSGN